MNHIMSYKFHILILITGTLISFYAGYIYRDYRYTDKKNITSCLQNKEEIQSGLAIGNPASEIKAELTLTNQTWKQKKNGTVSARIGFPEKNNENRLISSENFIFPSKDMVYVYHMVMKGECLSHFVHEEMIYDVIRDNRIINDPDKIKPGMIIRLKVPRHIADLDIYMKDYEIHKKTDASGNLRYILNKRIVVNDQVDIKWTSNSNPDITDTL